MLAWIHDTDVEVQLALVRYPTSFEVLYLADDAGSATEQDHALGVRVEYGAVSFSAQRFLVDEHGLLGEADGSQKHERDGWSGKQANPFPIHISPHLLPRFS
jgi:hypothetical protein